MFELDVRSRKPIYEQLIERMKEMIMMGVLQPDEQLPSVRHLSGQLTVNPNTIQKAYRELEREGYIYSLQGKGSFVAKSEHRPDDKRREELKTELRKLFAEAVYLGFKDSDIAVLYTSVKNEIHIEGQE
ncbi:GntR family transcriptional regulator [Paenibacillus sp. Marseille-Q4541]|uniref:GntR family transcriptional regulator n=1 Tax=Paenibacillus sp. Marseille-Q4541 TaxID=2831522 RepID=UPI001BA820BA|nr:GntR family transcriptional regulator [Paenibacillus sp. Marseille-Q4541]